MPNWCSTRITINSEQCNKLKQLEKLINEWTSKDYKDNGFGLNWLGNIVGNSQIGTVDKNDETYLKCRGSLTYMEYTDNQLIIDTETAWVPMLKMWIRIIEKYIPDAELIYEAEECGCGIQCTNDPCLQGKYVIDVWDIDDMESDYEASEETVVSVLQRLLKTKESNVANLISLLQDSDHSDGMSVRQWEFCEAYNWD